MTVDTVIHNAKIYFEGAILEAGIAVDDGKIVKIAKEANLPSSSRRINLKGFLALPGLIDAHVHLRGQLLAYKEDFYTGTAAAVAGGITSVLDMPNNKPVTMDPFSLRNRVQIAEQEITANVGFFSAFPEDISHVNELAREGAVGFKVYLTAQVGGIDVDDDTALLSAFGEAGELKVPVAVHAEDRKHIDAVVEEERKRGRNDVNAFIEAYKPKVEAKAVERILGIARKTIVQVHFCHVSSAETLSIIQKARRDGLSVTCEVTPHHLLLTSADLKRQGPMLLTDPPVRNKHTARRLWAAVKSNLVEIIASDHAPHSLSEKSEKSVWDVKLGVPGLETLLPLLLTRVNEGWLSIGDLVRLTAEKPAEIFHLAGQGFLKEGSYADITVVDLHQEGKIQADSFQSKAKYSPFDGWRVRGLPVKTFVNGKLAMDEGDIVAERGIGRIIRGRG